MSMTTDVKPTRYNHAVILKEWNEAEFRYEEFYILTTDVEMWQKACMAPLQYIIKNYSLVRR